VPLTASPLLGKGRDAVADLASRSSKRLQPARRDGQRTATGFDAAAGATVSPLLRVLTMKPGPVAASGLRALSQGNAMTVAGLSNKMAAFSNRLTPRAMQRATMRSIMEP